MENNNLCKDMKKMFKLGVHGILTACSKQDFCNAFTSFTQAEKERLYALYVQVIVSLHKNIEDEFDEFCDETKVGSILDTVEGLVEEQTLDPLCHDETNLNDVAKELSTLKKNEIQNLTTLLEKTEAQNKVMKSRVELLRKEIQDSYAASKALEKVKT